MLRKHRQKEPYIWHCHEVRWLAGADHQQPPSITGGSCCCWHTVSEGRFASWTRKSDQGVARALIGCWTRPGTTLVYTEEKMGEGPYMEVEVPKCNFQGLINALTWSNGFLRWERQERGGMVGKGMGFMAEKCRWNIVFWEILLGAHFLASIWCGESWEASPPSNMCLNHITATRYAIFSMPYPLKIASKCFVK